MVHGGELKGALEVCGFHTRDPPVEYSSHTSRRNAWDCFYFICDNNKKRGSLDSRVVRKLHWHCLKVLGPSGSGEDCSQPRSKDLVKS